MIDQVTIPREVAQAVFDIATGSLNFGSGFLDTEEVEALRALAVAIGVDPMVGTPYEFAVRTPHPYTPDANDTASRYGCRYCRRYLADHPAADAVRAP